MGLLNLLKSKQTKYSEQVGKMDVNRVTGLLDLMTPEMKIMLMSQISGQENGLPKEQKDRISKLLKQAQQLPPEEKFDLLTTDHMAMMKKGKEQVEVCSYLQSKWKEIEEHYGKKITDSLPLGIKTAFSLGNDFTHSDLAKAAEKKENVALLGALAYCVLLDAHQNGQGDVAFFCENKIRVDKKLVNQDEKSYQLALKFLDRERQFEDKKKEKVKSLLNGR